MGIFRSPGSRIDRLALTMSMLQLVEASGRGQKAPQVRPGTQTAGRCDPARRWRDAWRAAHVRGGGNIIPPFGRTLQVAHAWATAGAHLGRERAWHPEWGAEARPYGSHI